MAIAQTVIKQDVLGSKRVVIGSFTVSGGGTGGDIITGLNRVDDVILQGKGTGVIADAHTINETFPCGGTITIVTRQIRQGTGWP